MIKHVKKIMVLAFVIALAMNVAVFTANAQPDLGTNYVDPIGLQTTNLEPQAFAAQVVTYLMTFLGIIAVIIILIGGFRWMTAAGNEDRVASAKKTIIAGAIGLVVILAAYAIVTFVIDISNKALEGNIGG